MKEIVLYLLLCYYSLYSNCFTKYIE